ncbi:MAG: hypothetical protein JWO86_47 [Myxococcaceae bacterium]|nr:hypothetical protein [Myxococcaceae bacterium]
MLRLTIAGPDTKLLSSLCAACPYSPAGCCVAPPRLDLSDVGRIVAHGGRDWLLAEIAQKRIAVGERWLFVARPKRPLVPGGAREAACVYHGATGCTIPHERRSATCNYYLCDAARAGDGDDAALARATHDELVAKFVAWDAELTSRVAASWPEGPTFDAAFLDWLGETFTELTRASA